MMNTEQFVSLRENALQRLGVWTTKAKESGIDRLIIKYPKGLEKIKSISSRTPKIYPDPGVSLVGRWPKIKRKPKRGVIRATKSKEEFHVDPITGTKQNSSKEELNDKPSYAESKRSNSDSSLLESQDYGRRHRKGRRKRYSKTKSKSKKTERNFSKVCPDGSSSTNIMASTGTSTLETGPDTHHKCKTRIEDHVSGQRHLHRRTVLTHGRKRMMSLIVLRTKLRFLTSGLLKLDGNRRAAWALAGQRDFYHERGPGNTTHRFRTMARSIWFLLQSFADSRRRLKEIQIQLDENVTLTPAKLCFDVQEFKNSAFFVNGLSRRAKNAVYKPSRVRTEADILCLLEIIERLPLFSEYSSGIKYTIASLIQYNELEKGRVVVKQGDPGTRLYWVVAGKLSSYMTETDKDTGCYRVQHMKDINVGTHFGNRLLKADVNTLHHTTIVCKDQCELLSLYSDEIHRIINEKLEQEHLQLVDFLKLNRYFSSWTDDQLVECSNYIDLQRYDDNEVIFDNRKEKNKMLYIIKSGTCYIVRRLKTISLKSPYRSLEVFLPYMVSEKPFMAKPYGKAKGLRSFIQEYKFVKIYTLLAGDFFNAGESMDDIYIVANRKVSCMRVRYSFYDINSKKHELVKMAESREMQILSDKEIYELLIVDSSWQRYKEKLVKEIKMRKNLPTFTKIKDVPKSIIEKIENH